MVRRVRHVVRHVVRGMWRGMWRGIWCGMWRGMWRGIWCGMWCGMWRGMWCGGYGGGCGCGKRPAIVQRKDATGVASNVRVPSFRAYLLFAASYIITGGARETAVSRAKSHDRFLASGCPCIVDIVQIEDAVAVYADNHVADDERLVHRLEWRIGKNVRHYEN